MTALPGRRAGAGRPAKPWWREWLEAIAFALFVTTFVVSGVHVDGASMMPNLRSGELVLVPKALGWLRALGVGEYARGDIIVFKPPAEASGEWRDAPMNLWRYQPFLIKRVIGLPGDQVRVQGGEVWVNGRALDQSFITDYWRAQGCWDTRSLIANHAQNDIEYPFVPNAQAFTVPAGRYFVMGDNRSANGSEDSRLFGTVARRDIAGPAAISVWPLTRSAQADVNCRYIGPRPQDQVRFSGLQRWNPRLLGPPASLRAAP